MDYKGKLNDFLTFSFSNLISSSRVPPDSRGTHLSGDQPFIRRHGDSLDLLHLLGVRRHPAPTVHDQQDRRGRIHHLPLPFRPWSLPSSLHLQLGLQVEDYKCFYGVTKERKALELGSYHHNHFQLFTDTTSRDSST